MPSQFSHIRRYGLEISPQAWLHIGALPAQVFRSLREELLTAGQRAEEQARSELAEGLDGTALEGREQLFTLPVGEVVAHFSISVATRTVTLVEVAPTRGPNCPP
jgi:hypothetical protein